MTLRKPIHALFSMDPASREERIRAKAFARFQRRGDGAGEAADDWLAAEANVDDENAQRT
jgi:hypothetical protein